MTHNNYDNLLISFFILIRNLEKAIGENTYQVSFNYMKKDYTRVSNLANKDQNLFKRFIESIKKYTL